jgi:hypothetical protein
MSDSSQGPGWWLASDGKWYPPEATPAAATPPPTDPPPAAAAPPPKAAPPPAAPPPAAPPPTVAAAAPAAAPAPAKKSGGSGCAKAIIAFVIVLAVIGILFVAALVAGIGFLGHKVESAAKKLEKEQQVEDKTHISTIPLYYDSDHPPQYDIWKRPLSCSTQSDGTLVASGTVKNNTGSPKSYLVFVTFSQGGNDVGTGTDGIANVKAGDTAAWRIVDVGANVSGKITCTVTAIYRSDLFSIIPSGH